MGVTFRSDFPEKGVENALNNDVNSIVTQKLPSEMTWSLVSLLNLITFFEF